MAIGTMDFPLLTPQQTSPLGGVLSDAIAKRLKMAETEKQEALLPYVGQMAQAQLTGLNQQNQWNPKIWESEIGLRGAQQNLSSEQAKKIEYLLNNPGFMGGDLSKEITALKLMGYIPEQPNPTRSTPLTQDIAQNLPFPQMQGDNQLQRQPQQDMRTSLINRLSNPQLSQTLDIQNDQQNQQSQTPIGSFNNPASFIRTGNPMVDALIANKFAGNAYKQQMTQGYNWAHLPSEAKNQLISQGLGMGISPMKMMKYVNQGYDISQIAQAEGLDPNNLPPPIYNPTKATLTRVQQVEQVGNELDYLSSASTPLISKYADTFAGYSPERITDMLSDNPEAQKRFGKYIGALSIQSGLANGRVLLEGGRSGLEVMRMVKDSALKGIDQHTPIKMSKIAYEEAQKTIDNILQRGAKIRTATGMNPYSEVGLAHGKEGGKSVKSMSDDELLSEAKSNGWI